MSFWSMSRLTCNNVQIVSEKYMEHPYPEQPDDGTWEGEGGYVAKPNPIMYVIDDIWSYGQKTIVVHPLTYAMLEHELVEKEEKL
jgi:hypothetical protein